MLKSFKFHHIGIAVKDIDSCASMYENAGFRRSRIVYDPIQNVNICFLEKIGMPMFELVAPMNDSSPINKILEKNGTTLYHNCFIVPNIDCAVSSLRELHYIQISRPAKAVAFRGSKVAFLFNKNTGLIELVEEPAEIIE